MYVPMVLSLILVFQKELPQLEWIFRVPFCKMSQIDYYYAMEQQNNLDIAIMHD